VLDAIVGSRNGWQPSIQGEHMKRMIFATLLLALSACGGDEPRSFEDPVADAARAARERDEEAKRQAHAGLDSVEYPECEVVANNKKSTSCGLAVVEKAMSECTTRVLAWSGASSVLDEFAGDSWISAAGERTVLPTKERAKRLASSDMAKSQYIAVLPGNGARSVVVYECSLDDDWHLRGIYSAGARSVN